MTAEGGGGGRGVKQVLCHYSVRVSVRNTMMGSPYECWFRISVVPRLDVKL